MSRMKVKPGGVGNWSGVQVNISQSLTQGFFRECPVCGQVLPGAMVGSKNHLKHHVKKGELNGNDLVLILQFLYNKKGCNESIRLTRLNHPEQYQRICTILGREL